MNSQNRFFRKPARLITSSILCCFVMTTIVPPSAFARSRAGGGETKDFDFAQFAIQAGSSIALAGAGSAIKSAVGTGWSSLSSGMDTATTLSNMGSSFTNSLSQSYGTLSGMSTGFNTFMAASQVSRGVSNMGNYYDWDKGITYMASTIASGAAAGFVNPTASLGNGLSRATSATFSDMLEGAFVGGMTGLGSGGAIVAIDGDKIRDGESPGVLAQTAGFASGLLAAQVGRAIVSPGTYSMTNKQHVYDNSSKKFKPVDGNGASIASKDLVPPGMKEAFGDLSLTDYQKIYQESRPIGDTGLFEYNTQQGPVHYSLGSNNTFSERGFSDLLQYGGYSSNKVVNVPINGDVSTGTIVGRLTIDPLVGTLNMWPQVAASAIGSTIAEQVDTKNTYLKPIIRGAVSGIVGPALDSFATTYSLKPSLFTDIDANLGKVPELRQAQYALFDKSIKHTILETANDFNYSKSDTITQDDVKKYLEEKGISNEKIRDTVASDFMTSRTQNIEPKEALMAALSRETGNQLQTNAQEFYSNKQPGLPDNTKVLDSIGGSRFDTFSTLFVDNLKYEIPVQAISFGTQLGMAKLAGKDKGKINKDGQWEEKDDALTGYLVGLAGSAITGAARGAVWAVYSNELENKEMAKVSNWMSEGISGANPHEFNTEVNAGNMYLVKQGIKVVDEKYKITDKRYVEKDGLTMTAERIDALAPGLKDNKSMTLDGYIREKRKQFDTMAPEQRSDPEMRQLQNNLNQLASVKEYYKVEKADADTPANETFVMARNTTARINPENVNRIIGIRDGSSVTVLTPNSAGYEAARSKLTAPRDEFAMERGVLSPAGQYEIDGKRVTVIDTYKAPDAMTTVMGSLGQSLYEFGTQTVAMGLPLTYQSHRMNAYSWYQYAAGLNSMSRTVASNGLNEAWGDAGYQNGVGVTNRAILTSLADTPIGTALGMAPIVPVSGFTGMPFSVAKIKDIGTGKETVFELKYPMVTPLITMPRDPFYGSFEVKQQQLRDPTLSQINGNGGDNSTTNGNGANGAAITGSSGVIPRH